MRGLLLLVGALVAAVVGLPAPAATAGPWPDVPVDEPVCASCVRGPDGASGVEVPTQGWLVLHGHGWGHGHGLSQYGAGGRAAAGHTWEQITSFYYPGTQRGSAGGDIAVRISADTTPDLVVRARPGLALSDPASGTTTTLPGGVPVWRVAPRARGGHGLFRWSGEGAWPWKLERLVGASASFSAGGAPLTLVTPSGDVSYRGRLTASSGGTVNTLALEDYVRGVVPREIPSSWPGQAVAAQAVAARSYAAHQRAAHGYGPICDTTSCQVYGGASAETAAGNAAVDATSGVVLLWQGGYAMTQFSSSNGGRSLAGSAPYLVTRKDRYDAWRPNGNHDWVRRVSDAVVEARWPQLGDLQAAYVTGREGGGEWGGRVTEVLLVGRAGRVRVGGATIKAVWGLKERWFTFAGSRVRYPDKSRPWASR